MPAHIAQVFLVHGIRNFIDVFEQRERFPDGQVPPELGSLAEYDADLFGVANPFPVRDQSVHLDDPRGRNEYAGQHFDRG